MLTLFDSYQFSAHPNTSTFDWLQGFGIIVAAPQNVLLHPDMHMDLLIMSVHFLNFLTLSSPYYVSFQSLASGAKFFLTMHPRPVTFRVIGALYPIVLPKSPSSGILLGVLYISAAAIALADAVRWSNCTVWSKRRSVGSRIKGSASQDLEWDGLTFASQQTCSVALPAKQANQRLPSVQAEHRNLKFDCGMPTLVAYEPGIFQIFSRYDAV